MHTSSEKIIKVAFAVLSSLLIIALGAAYYFYRQSDMSARNSKSIVEDEVNSVVERVGKLMILPEGETPTVATVTDPERLKDQVFFSNAQKGDKVLIYTNAKKAVLYRPAMDKIIEVAPLNIGK